MAEGVESQNSEFKIQNSERGVKVEAGRSVMLFLSHAENRRGGVEKFRIQNSEFRIQNSEVIGLVVVPNRAFDGRIGSVLGFLFTLRAGEEPFVTCDL
ncbi:MAG: hypothetical protein ACOCVG_02880 [Verrucomicrobiota bacterium]